jgi:putative (di)nucleoside polyphosphate hydrolase
MRSGRPDYASSQVTDLLSDPIVRKVMDADKVDMSALLALLARMANRLKEQHLESTAGAVTMSECVPPFDPRFRPGVGIMLVNDIGQVLVGKRADMIDEAWQMPQGGIDADETPIKAAMRELLEEVGTANVAIVAESSRWLQYELPSSLQGRPWGGQWRGQRQKWFLMRFLGEDREINIVTEHPEFSEWKWVSPERLVDSIVAFKHRLYLEVVGEFADFLSRAQHKAADF